MNTPFCRKAGFGDWIGSRIGLIATNYLRYGLLDTAGAQSMDVELTAKPDRVYYHGHPATVPLFTAAVMAATGSTEPWTQRTLPLLASISGVALLVLLLQRTQPRITWWAVLLYVASPVLGWHGTTPSYEPFCLPIMLGILLMWEHGWRRASVAGCLCLGGLVDFAVLYLVPPLCLRSLCVRRKEMPPARLGTAIALAAAGAASIGLHILHVAWSWGDFTGNWQESLPSKIGRSLLDARIMPPVTAFVAAQWDHLVACFTVPLLLGATLSTIIHWRTLGWPAWCFAFAGFGHILLFRNHAMKHDFWPWYAMPFIAIAGARMITTWPRWLAAAFAATVGGFAAHTTLSIWIERDRIPVRDVATDVDRLFDRDMVLHQARGPEGWSIDFFRRAPVFDLADWLTQAAQMGSFRDYLDGVAMFGALSRTHVAYLFVPGSQQQDTGVLDAFFPGAFREELQGEVGRYRAYDVSTFLIDPGSSDTFLKLLGRDECQRHHDRARLHLVLPLLPRGTRLIWLTGEPGPWEPLRGRLVRTGDGVDIDAKQQGHALAAWPGTPMARRLEETRSVRYAELTAMGRRWRIPLVVE